MNSSGPEPSPSSSIRWLFLAGLLVVVTFAAHFPAILAGFIWDDKELLYGNPLITQPGGLSRIWFTAQQWDYWPLSSTSLWVEWRLWRDDPLPYHISNIFLHSFSAVLLWRVLRRLRLSEPSAYLAGLIFAVHPVAVASVAWISERKNVLTMVCYLLSILAFLRFDEDRQKRWYGLALLAAAAALLSKTSVVMLPFVLGLCVWWKYGRIIREQALRIVPFLLLSLAMGLVTVWFQHSRAMGGEISRPEGMASRIAACGWIIWFYLYKALVPVRLLMLYPRWDVDGHQVLSFLPLIALIGCFPVLWIYRRTWARAPLAALAYFVIALVPVLGLVDMAFMRYALVADHLQYVALPGVIALVAAVVGTWGRRAWTKGPGLSRYFSGVTLCAIVAVPAVLTWRQASVYKNEETLWNHNILINPDIWAAYIARGDVYRERGEIDRGIKDYTRSIELHPSNPEAYNNRGYASYARHTYDDAIRDFSRAIELKPGNPSLYNNRGYVCLAQGEYAQAVRDFTRTIELKPDHARAHANRAAAYCLLKEFDRSWDDVTKCRQLGGTPDPALVKELEKATGRTQ